MGSLWGMSNNGFLIYIIFWNDVIVIDYQYMKKNVYIYKLKVRKCRPVVYNCEIREKNQNISKKNGKYQWFLLIKIILEYKL